MNKKYQHADLIELFKSHSSAPFPDDMTNREHWVLLTFFWLYFTKIFVNSKGDEYKGIYSYTDFYAMLEDYNKTPNLLGGRLIYFYENQSKRDFCIEAIGNNDRKHGYTRTFGSSIRMEDFLMASTENPDNMLESFGFGVDFSDDEAIDKAKLLMHDFFIKKLSFDEMDKRIEELDPSKPYEPDDD